MITRQPDVFKNATKQIIFLAAAELFAEKGYLETSMKDIAHKCYIQAPSIYYHFANKEEILDALLDYYLMRMEIFYDNLANKEIDATKSLEETLATLMLRYEEDEVELMMWLTRIVHHEQFRLEKAAQALIGTGYHKFVDAHVHFLNRLVGLGMIKKQENTRLYGEMFARVSLSFALQFLHPEVPHIIKDQSVMGQMISKLIVSHEKDED